MGLGKWHIVWAEARQSLLWAAALLVFMCSSLALYLRYGMPKLQAEDLAVLKAFPPGDLEHLKLQREVVLKYGANNPVSVLLGYCMLYVSMQTFALPGTIYLSLLSGALFGVWRGLALVSVVSTLGSATCYTLSCQLGRNLAKLVWPVEIEKFAAEVEQRRNDLLNYIIFLRVTPILPNTFINVASPIVNVPLTPFILGTFLGCIPNNFVAVNAGSRLSELKSLRDFYGVRLLALGAAVGAVALFPVYWKHRVERQKVIAKEA